MAQTGNRANIVRRATPRDSVDDRLVTLEDDRQNLMKRVGILEALPPPDAVVPPIPVFRAKRIPAGGGWTDQTIPDWDGTNTDNVLWNTYENTDATVFTESLVGPDLQGVEFNKKGLYSMGVVINWSLPLWSGNAGIELVSGGLNGILSVSPAEHWLPRVGVGGNDRFQTFSFTFIVDLIGSNLLVRAIQDSGVDRDLSDEDCLWDLAYHGATDILVDPPF